jgi:hypothetical protein
MLLFFLLILGLILGDINVYVSNGGNDSGNCSTISSPCKSLDYTYAQAGSDPNVNIHVLSTS